MDRGVNYLYEFGPFRLDPQEQTLLRDGRPIPLRPKVFDILLVLIENRGHLVDKEQLMTLVWQEQFVEEGNINKNISMLRRALGEGDNGQQFIETVPKRGYRFIGDVRELTTGEAAASTRIPVRTTWFRRRWIPVLVVPALLIAAVAYFLIYGRRVSPAPTITSIVVLPLQNLSGDPAQEYFADGMTDALIGDLAQLGALRVISRTSAMHYKGTDKPLPEIARELKVDAVVEGTIQRSGDRVHVRAQLIHAPSDSHLWAAEYDRDLGDALDLQSEVARSIATEVRIKITPAEERRLVSKRVIKREAIDYYLQGRYFLSSRTEQNLRKAIQFFESAIQTDPTYAQAYAGLADCYNQLGTVMIGVMPPSEARRTAEIAARKALEIDNDVAEAHATLGYVDYFNWNWTTAEAEFKRSTELNPNYASGHSQYAYYLVARGRFDEALAEINRAQELDPLSLSISSSRGFILEHMRRYDDAIEQLRRVVAIDPNYYQANWSLALTYIAKGQIDEAIIAAEKTVAVSGRAPAALGVLGLAYGFGGKNRDTNKVLNELLQMEKHRYVSPMAFVYVYIGLGDKDHAFAWLEKSIQERSNHLAFFKVSPTVDRLRSDSRFPELLKRIGLG